MIRACKICGIIIAILFYIWIADYGFIMVSEKSTTSVVMGVVVFLILLLIAITSISWYVPKIIKKFEAKPEVKNSKKEETKKCCG